MALGGKPSIFLLISHAVVRSAQIDRPQFAAVTLVPPWRRMSGRRRNAHIASSAQAINGIEARNNRTTSDMLQFQLYFQR